MISAKIKHIILFLLVSHMVTYSFIYDELVPKFNRYTSHVMVRKVKEPILAYLDFAAYDKNPVLYEQITAKPKKIPRNVVFDSISFSGNLKNSFDRIEDIPVSSIDKETPVAWKPLIKRLWGIVKDDHLQSIGQKINVYKWDDPSVYQTYQELTSAYFVRKNKKIEIWVKIEFSPWVKFIDADDEDGDGSREIYGQLVIDSIPQDSLEKTYTWVKDDYLKKKLNKEGMTDWITDLASYWYPSKNTDILELSEQNSWPDSRTPKKIIKVLQNLSVLNPLAVVEGKPFSPDEPIYNVYVIDNLMTSVEEIQKVDDIDESKKNNRTDTSISENFINNNNRFNNEISNYGTYLQWQKKNETFLNQIKGKLDSLPSSQMGIEGINGWLVFRKSMEYLNSGDLSVQQIDKNPLIHLVEFNNYCKKHSINLLFVPVPSKEEIYPEKIIGENIVPEIPYVNPFGRKVLKDLQDKGVEVIDILPDFLKDKATDTTLLYQLHDTHWTTKGLEITAKRIAERIQKYSWYKEISKNNYSCRDTFFERLGDIVDKLPESSQINYRPSVLSAKQVRDSSGNLFKGNASSPVMLIGDSFTGVFESVDCKSAGVGSHIAYLTGLPIDIITSWGGGPMVRQKAMKAREKNIESKKLIIYMMTDRDLFNYSQSWEHFPALQK